jgi:dTDP-glucose 4,6-dehydratase
MKRSYKIKRVLLTGAAGFVGHHVLKHVLNHTDFEVVCLIRLNSAGSLKNLSPFYDNPRVKFTYHDLKFSVNEALREDIAHIDYIVHIGANSHVDRSITHPKEFFEDNVMGTINLLEYMRLYMPDARMINFSTDEVYGPAPEQYKFREEDRFRPSNPYSASKAAQIEAGYSYFRTYELDVISTFTMNIFGPNQSSEKLIPKAIRYAKEGKPMPVFAELSQDELINVGSRHWLYVANVGDALLFILQNGVKGEYYNIVGTDELTNEEVVNKVNELLGIKKPLIEYVDFHKSRPGHDRRYAIDGTKLKNLGWMPTINFDEGIQLVINNL